MKSKLALLTLALVGLIAVSCDYESVRASGEVSVNEVRLSDYSRLKVSNAFNAYVTFSDTEEKIEVEANDNLHDKIIVNKEGNTLVVRLKRHTNVKGNATMNIFITTKSISHFDISGASTITLENELHSPDVEIELSGASEFSGDLYTNELFIDASGASKTDLFGTTEYLGISLSGSSTVQGYGLVSDQLKMDLSGASDAYLTVSQTIDVEASGASKLYYKGNATVVHKDLSGASELIKKE